MVYFYNCTALGEGKAVTIYAGKDKVENEDIIRYALPHVHIWVHVDKLSSPHIYIRLPDWLPSWEAIPKQILDDAAQLVKAGSIQGNKKDNVTIIYTPASNLLKTGDMDVGTVYVAEPINAIVDRLNKTRVERIVDHEAEKIEREQKEAKERRLEANERRNKELELSRQRKVEAESRDYSRLHERKEALSYEDEEAEWNSRQKEGDFDPEEDFM
ncbi:BQ2448_6183 [Microbotryum intermedium]|uniref:BQ2448_6183 protein n=1 Tax=Microbotryum intermedium TaxID=269621 RepID=A0A238FP22_9BASI|nr:BQ2448_6183 [Microbotryum intermedium]